jgi:FkbM family methyltransferase
LVSTEEQDVFVDIGSHIGKYAIAVANTVGKEGLVIALEPHPETFKVLQKNIKLNHLENVVALNLAAWKDSATLKFYIGSTPSEFSVNRSLFDKSINVQAKRIDELLLRELKLRRVDWIKIDVEKAELEVLQGPTETLATFKPKLLMEVWGNNIKRVKSLLKTCGYDMILISNVFTSKAEWCVYFLCVQTL